MEKESLLNQFQDLLKELQKKEAVKNETERLAKDLSKSLDMLLKESKAQREQDASAIKEAMNKAETESREKEAAKLINWGKNKINYC